MLKYLRRFQGASALLNFRNVKPTSQNIYQTKVNVLKRNPPNPIREKKFSSYRCWNCEFGSDRFTLKCQNCQKIQDAKNSNLFEILGQSVAYDLDESELKKVYKRLQSEFHPDKFTLGSDKEMQLSENASSIINKAYFTLMDPYERGMYILKLKRFTPKEDIGLDKAFLMEVMERNEELECLIGTQEIDKFEEENNIQIEEIRKSISTAFSAQDFTTAKSELQRMKYYVSIRNRLKEMKNKALE